MYENTKTNTGDKDPIVWASAKAKYRKDKTNETFVWIGWFKQ